MGAVVIRDPECPRCYGYLEEEMGPADAPDADGNVVMETVLRCRVCGWSEYVDPQPVSEADIERAVAAVAALHGVEDLDERGRVLAEHGFVAGKRWWPPC